MHRTRAREQFRGLTTLLPDFQRSKDAAKLDEVTGTKQQSSKTMSLVATPGRCI